MKNFSLVALGGAMIGGAIVLAIFAIVPLWPNRFDLKWLAIPGLVFDIVGAVVLAKVLIVSKEEVEYLGVARYAYDTLEKNLGLPTVQDRLRQSKHAIIGTGLLILGFFLQLLATTASLTAPAFAPGPGLPVDQPASSVVLSNRVPCEGRRLCGDCIVISMPSPGERYHQQRNSTS